MCNKICTMSNKVFKTCVNTVDLKIWKLWENVKFL